jgi:arginyl-tRNA synthetase
MTAYQDPLQARLAPALERAFIACFGTPPPTGSLALQPTRPEFEGDLTLNVFPFLKLSKQGPEATAQALGKALLDADLLVRGFQVIKGFLNLVIADEYWLDFSRRAAVENLLSLPSTGRKVLVEFSSPNTNKPLHLGHLRNNFLGHSVSELLRAAGNQVVRVQVINDRGIHICKSMIAWQLHGNGETPKSTGWKGDKLVGKYYVKFNEVYRSQVADLLAQGHPQAKAEAEAPILLGAQEMLRKWEANDVEVRTLWNTMNAWVYEGFNTTYARMGVTFDQLYFESNTYLLGKSDVQQGLAGGVLEQEADGSVWVDNTKEGLDRKVLLRKDGTSVYMTQDIGTAIQRVKDHPGLASMVYVVGNEQDYHFKTLFITLRKLGFEWAKGLHHLSYGMVDLPSGRMKSREGTVVDADDLMEEVVQEARAAAASLGREPNDDPTADEALHEMVGMAALKYFLLKVDPRKRMVFDPSASIDLNGHTGPFIQYTHARIRSLLRKASQDQFGEATAVQEGLLPIERQLIQLLHALPAVLDEGARDLDPSGLANQIYELAKTYNSYYQSTPVLREADDARRAFRLRLSKAVADHVQRGMAILGINVPERM